MHMPSGAAIRRASHRGFGGGKTQKFRLRQVVPGIGRTGVVGVIRGRKAGGKVVGLRANMDALPLEEETGLPYKSTVPGKMQPAATTATPRCCWSRQISRRDAQFRRHRGGDLPAGRGGRRRCPGHGQGRPDHPLRHRGSLRHAQFPGPAGRPVRHPPGPIMASADHIAIELEGKGGHAAGRI